MNATILVIEDNENLAYGLCNNLEIEGYQTLLAQDGNQALLQLRRRRVDLVILDLMLPELDGFQVLRRMREMGNRTPVLILSARGEELDKVRGFRFGADQYVTKPFSVLELMARVESLLKRDKTTMPEPPPVDERLHFGTISINRGAREVTKSGRTIALAPKEYDLLLALFDRNGAVAGRLDLIQEVWGYSGEVLTRTVDTHIGELRRKLEDDPNQPQYLLTVRKAGYRLKREL